MKIEIRKREKPYNFVKSGTVLLCRQKMIVENFDKCSTLIFIEIIIHEISRLRSSNLTGIQGADDLSNNHFQTQRAQSSRLKTNIMMKNIMEFVQLKRISILFFGNFISGFEIERKKFVIKSYHIESFLLQSLSCVVMMNANTFPRTNEKKISNNIHQEENVYIDQQLHFNFDPKHHFYF